MFEPTSKINKCSFLLHSLHHLHLLKSSFSLTPWDSERTWVLHWSLSAQLCHYSEAAASNIAFSLHTRVSVRKLEGGLHRTDKSALRNRLKLKGKGVLLFLCLLYIDHAHAELFQGAVGVWTLAAPFDQIKASLCDVDQLRKKTHTFPQCLNWISWILIRCLCSQCQFISGSYGACIQRQNYCCHGLCGQGFSPQWTDFCEVKLTLSNVC